MTKYDDEETHSTVKIKVMQLDDVTLDVALEYVVMKLHGGSLNARSIFLEVLA